MIRNMQIGKYILDKQQEEIVRNEDNYLLVTAGAGSGKTLTILGKISYLVKEKKISENEILCISFTKSSAESLKQKIKQELILEVPTYTFHKLSLEIIKEEYKNYEIASDSLLEDIVNEFFEIDIYHNPYLLMIICKYFKEKTKKKELAYQKIMETKKNEIFKLKQLSITFIKLMKCNNYNLKDFLLFLSKIKKSLNYVRYKKEKTILTLILNIYLKYENYIYAFEFKVATSKSEAEVYRKFNEAVA